MPKEAAAQPLTALTGGASAGQVITLQPRVAGEGVHAPDEVQVNVCTVEPPTVELKPVAQDAVQTAPKVVDVHEVELLLATTKAPQLTGSQSKLPPLQVRLAAQMYDESEPTLSTYPVWQARSHTVPKVLVAPQVLAALAGVGSAAHVTGVQLNAVAGDGDHVPDALHENACTDELDVLVYPVAQPTVHEPPPNCVVAAAQLDELLLAMDRAPQSWRTHTMAPSVQVLLRHVYVLMELPACRNPD